MAGLREQKEQGEKSQWDKVGGCLGTDLLGFVFDVLSHNMQGVLWTLISQAGLESGMQVWIIFP